PGRERAPHRRPVEPRRRRRGRGPAGRARREGARALRAGRARHLRPPLRGAGVRAVDRGRRSARARRPAAGVRCRARRALRVLGPGRRARAGDRSGGGRRTGAGAAGAPGGGGRARRLAPGRVRLGARRGRRRARGARRTRRARDRGARGVHPGRAAGLALRDGRRRHPGDGTAGAGLVDAVTLQVMVGALRAAWEETAGVLVRSAHSANIKEPRDASTALFDASREMGTQADPHTADGGGVGAGPRRPVKGGGLGRDVLEGITSRMRGPRQRMADLRAQLAANRAGGARVAELAERHGLELVREAMDATLDYAERRTRAAIARLGDGEREARDVLEAPEGDLELRLTARVAGDAMTL